MSFILNVYGWFLGKPFKFDIEMNVNGLGGGQTHNADNISKINDKECAVYFNAYDYGNESRTEIWKEIKWKSDKRYSIVVYNLK